MTKYICLIPARGNSKGIPGKNIINFNGKPLIGWSIESAIKSNKIDEVYVTSDSQQILETAKTFGAKSIKRPSDLSTDKASSESALLHAVEHLKNGNINPENIVFLQATSPLRDSNDIDGAIQEFEKNNADSLFSCTKLEDFFIWEKTASNYVSVTYDFNNRKPRQDISPQYLENGSIYIFKTKQLLEKKNRLGGNIAVYEMPFWKSYQIDNREDIELCEFYAKRMNGSFNE